MRVVCPIREGEELSIAYIDVACPLPQLRAELLEKYNFDCGEAETRFSPAAVDHVALAALAKRHGTPLPAEPAALVPALTTLLEEAMATERWEEICTACDDLLWCYRYCYRVIHPRVGQRLATRGVAELCKPTKDLASAHAALSKGVKILSVTNGSEHGSTVKAMKHLDLVAKLRVRAAA